MNKNLFLFILCFTSACGLGFASGDTDTFAVYYADKADAIDFSMYDLVVLDQEFHPDLQGLTDQGIKKFGYISCVELGDFRWYFDKVKNRELLLYENPQFPGSWFIDIRQRKWRRFIVNQVVPSIIKQGFEGVFLDTLDDAVYLESQDPVAYAGMIEAAIDLVEAIRNRYPQMPIMVNRAYELLEEIGDMVDCVLGEEVFTRYNFETKKYELVPQDEYSYQLKALQAAKAEFPQLKVYTLDYWNPSDEEMLSEIYAKERENGFIPYVASVTLDEIIPE